MITNTITLSDIERALRSSWGVDTCAPEDMNSWRPDNPARGQCGVTAVVVNDLLGGDLVYGEVRVRAEFTDYHWWNRFHGIDIDLTREQFDPSEVVGQGTMVVRPPGPPNRCREQYELLRRRVFTHLGLAEGDGRGAREETGDHLADTEV
ncbi:YunG family protein [Streptomyces sp. NPDC005151]